MKEYIITLHIGIPEEREFDINDFEAFLSWTAANRPKEYSMEQAEQQDKEYEAFITGIHESHVIGYIEATQVEEDISKALEEHKKSLGVQS